MLSRDSIIIPAQAYSVSPSAKNEYDFTHSRIIESLSYEDIIECFGDIKSAVNYYRETLTKGFPRTASFLIAKLIKDSISSSTQNVAEGIILEELSMLSEDNMAAEARTLIARIAKPTAKKKILFSSAHWLTGGMERVMSVLFRELDNDYEIYLITPYDERISYIEVPDFVTSIKISNDLFIKHFDSIILSYALLLDIDVAIGYMNMFEKQLNFYKLCEGTKIKTVASNHEYYFYPYKSTAHYKVVEKRLSAFTKCDAIVWPNNFSAALCGMYLENSYVIGNPNNFDVVKNTHNAHYEKTIICVGRFNDYVKRIDRILECFALVLKKTPDAKLMLVGKYDNDSPFMQDKRTTVNDLISRLNIPSSSLNFVGETTDVQNYYADARVLMLTSNSEGFGMVLNEAACFGVPSVCNYIPGIEDIIADGENGYILEQGDLNSMALKVTEILTSDKLHNKLSENAKKKVSAYDSRHIGEKWKFLLNGLLEVKGKDRLQEKLNDKLGYKIVDQKKFSAVVADELNEIFYSAIEDRDKYIITNNTILLLLKVKTLPHRLRANIEFEGLINTFKKIAFRSLRIARSRLKI